MHTVYIFIWIEKRFNKVKKVCCIFSNKRLTTINGTSIVFSFNHPLSVKMLLTSDQY